MFFLAVILQGLTPFLHAHTGVSSQIGLHLHLSGTAAESSNSSKAELFLTSTSEESPEVGVPQSRQNDHVDFELADLLSLAFLLLPLIFFVAHPAMPSFGIDRAVYRYRAQNSLPPALAPPQTL